DLRGNRVLERDAAGHTVRRTFDQRNQLLTEAAYTVADPDGAGEAEPSGPLTTRHVYDTETLQQLRFTIRAGGGVTEHRYDGLGREVEVRDYGAALHDGVAFDETGLETWAAAHGEPGVRR